MSMVKLYRVPWKWQHERTSTVDYFQIAHFKNEVTWKAENKRPFTRSLLIGESSWKENSHRMSHRRAPATEGKRYTKVHITVSRLCPLGLLKKGVFAISSYQIQLAFGEGSG